MTGGADIAGLIRLESGLGRCSQRHNANRYAVQATTAELHGAFRHRKDGVIAPQANIAARMKFGATLTNDDVASDNPLTTVFFYTQSATRGIASVT